MPEWADRVWNSAKEGDLSTIERYLAGVPDGRAAGDIERVRGAYETLQKTRAESATTKATDLEKALADMRRNAGEEKLSAALQSASMAKLLSSDWTKTLATPDVSNLMAAAERKAKEAEASGDWLLAQELLFRLRVLVDRIGRPVDEEHYTDLLEKVNRRIGLLAQFAPHKLHELRAMQAKRLKPDAEFPPFNELGAEDWKDQLKGVTQPMLMQALRTAAAEHIINEGWKPLLDGGLSALRILATTSALDENFPGLRDPEKVKRWVDAIDAMQQEIDAKPSKSLGRGDYRDIMGRLIQLNRETINLEPESTLFHEFGEGATYQLSQLYDDQYTEIIWPERLRRFQQQTEGNFVGVGILIRQDEKRDIVVVNPLEGSPAYRAGVKPEDRIASVDGVTTLGWSLNKAVDNITGPRGKEVRLGIRRGEGANEKLIEIPVVRDTIKIRSVNGWWKRALDENGNPQWDWLIDPMSRIAYVRLTSFNEDSYADLLAAVDEIKKTGKLNGLILDLRNNPGGLLKSAVQFSNLFVPSGELVSGQDKDGRKVWHHDAQPNRAEARLADVPTVVLVNEGSASASEIVAGSLQAHSAAVILGERSFGKGSVQTVHDISDTEAAAIKLTTQYYVLPPRPGEEKGRLVHRRPGSTDWGVNPDLVVPMTPQQIEASMRLRQDADLIAGAEGVADEGVIEPEPTTDPAPGGAGGGGDPSSPDAKSATRRVTQKDKPRPDVSDLLSKGIDPQLQTALLILQARVLKDLEEAAVAGRRS